MKKTILLASSLLFCAAVLLAEQDTPLEMQMQILARSMKKLSMQINDPAKQQENVTLIESLKQAAITSTGLEPRKTASIPQADRDKFLADYRAQIGKLSEAFTQIEDSVKTGKYDEAKALITRIGSIKKDGHSKFKQD
jgi:soluble cytochrome b562